MHAELIFSIPEESAEFQSAMWGHRYRQTLDAIRTALRSRAKYGVNDAATLDAIVAVMDEIAPLMEEIV